MINDHIYVAAAAASSACRGTFVFVGNFCTGESTKVGKRKQRTTRQKLIRFYPKNVNANTAEQQKNV